MLNKAAPDIEVETYRTLRDEVWAPSRYEFLMGHHGIRPNSLIGLMAPTGAGKSTLFKCIIAELAAAGKKILIWLSEETVLEYQELISYLDKECLKNIVFVEEKKIPEEFMEDQKAFFRYFTKMVDDSGCDLVALDNASTSVFYNLKFGFNGQSRTATFMLGFVKRKCSIFYVCHTKKEVTANYNKVVTSEDMRNSKELGLVTEYFYVIQKFTSNEKIFNILNVVKFRHHEGAGGWHALAFEKRAYIGDRKIPFAMVNDIFNRRDYLGRKAPRKKQVDEKPIDFSLRPKLPTQDKLL